VKVAVLLEIAAVLLACAWKRTVVTVNPGPQVSVRSSLQITGQRGCRRSYPVHRWHLARKEFGILPVKQRVPQAAPEFTPWQPRPSSPKDTRRGGP
jgi:hypothetical protein